MFNDDEPKQINLYNKYRPKTFADVVGQDTIKHLLTQTFEQGKLIQSFLFYGPQGTGKTSLARIFAKAWNCSNFAKLGDVCNECKNCKLINEQKTIDVCEIDAASHSGVEGVRHLIQHTHYMPLDLYAKVYLLDECHNLSLSAWNAFLKVIEEPHTSNIVFIFLTTNIHKVPDTIISRCQKYSFSLIGNSELKSIIKKVEEGESKTIDKSAQQLLINLAQGSARECLSLLEQVFLATPKDTIEVKDLEKIFSLASRAEQISFLDTLIDSLVNPKKRMQLVELVESWILSNRHLFNYFSSIMNVLMDARMFEYTKDEESLKYLTYEEAERFRNRGVDYTAWCESLYNSIRSFGLSISKIDWARMTLLSLFSVDVQVKGPVKTSKKKTTVSTGLKITNPEQEKQFIYSKDPLHRELDKGSKNYEIYKSLNYKDDLDPKIQKVLFKPGAIFPNSSLITTDKTILFLFKEQKDADEFNSLLFSKNKYSRQLNDIFMSDYVWIASSIEQIDFYKNLPKYDEVEEEVKKEEKEKVVESPVNTPIDTSEDSFDKFVMDIHGED